MNDHLRSLLDLEEGAEPTSSHSRFFERAVIGALAF